MSCFDIYAKIPKTLPEELVEAARTDTGHGCLDLILKVRAANFWHESLTTLTDAQLIGYVQTTIDYLYPNLEQNNYNLYQMLTFRNEEKSMEELLNVMYNYQWWLGFVVGPNGCTRDIAYTNELMELPTNEEWSELLEQSLLKFQTENRYIEEVTGYVCCETFKRLRLLERGDVV